MIAYTKIMPPRLHKSHVSRPRLYGRLDEVLQRRLALVSAPAGYGKTSLVRGWLRELPSRGDVGRRLVVAWLSLDANDDDVARFVAGLVAALQAAVADKGDNALGACMLAMLEQPRRPPPAALVSNLLNELHDADSEFVLVLDDFHLLQSDDVQEAMALFVERLPAHAHVVITSRTDPPLPLWRWRAAGELVELRASDLRFSREETAGFLAQAMGLELPPEAIDRLDEQMEGWIAGLQMAALAGQERVVAEGAGNLSHAFDFLAAEVLERQPAPVQHFLLGTAILERLCSSLCDALLQGADRAGEESQGLLQQLVEGNLFLAPLDEEGRWFRYHHLFHAFLRRQLALRAADAAAPLPDVATLHARASDWYAENGAWEEAIHHALAAGNVERAAEVVGMALQGQFQRGRLVAIRRYLEMLPEEAILARHNFCVGYAWVLALGGEVQRVERYLQAAEKQLAILAQAEPVPALVLAQGSNVALIRATVAQRHGDVAAMARIGRRALETLESREAPALQSLAAYTLGQAHLMSGRMAEAQAGLQRAVGYGEIAGHLYLTCSGLASLAQVRRRQGRLQEAEALYRRIRQRVAGAEGGEEATLLGSATLGLGALAHERNRLEEAEALARHAVALYETSGEATGAIDAYTLLAQVQNGQGKEVERNTSLEKALALAQGWQLPVEIALLEAWRARFLLRAQNRRAALALARQAATELKAASGEGVAAATPLAFVELTRARANLAHGKHGASRARATLSRWQRFAKERGLSALQMETLLLQALVEQANGNGGEARRRIRHALMLAQAGGFVRLFLDEGPALAPLLGELRDDRVVGSLSAHLLQAGEHAGVGAEPRYAPVASLTERQREVLALLAHGLSNGEIAERLVISVETVRWHTKQIYRRLDVRNRTEAAQAQAAAVQASQVQSMT